MRIGTVLLGVLLTVNAGALVYQQAAAPAPAAAPTAPLSRTEDREEMRREIAQMRGLIDQMQRNLAQVSSGETALKHQFDLDIQMWQLAVNRMENQLGPDERQH
jgi:7-keto-8-aminopelargonate synthetase-like enzyme